MVDILALLGVTGQLPEGGLLEGVLENEWCNRISERGFDSNG
jgi:hypothetical protein